MPYVCWRCHQTVNKIIPLGDPEDTAWLTEVTGVPVHEYHYVCITCAREILDISDEDLIREERRLTNDAEFHLNLAKGRLAQVLIETIFQEFGYEVYPYGYESYLTNIIKNMRKGTSNAPVRKLRAPPDLFVYDREANNGFLTEVKATSTPDETRYWISKLTLNTYRAHWPESILVVYCVRTGNIYCKQMSEISVESLEVEQSVPTEKVTYVLNLEEDFQPLYTVFRLIERSRYESFVASLRQVLASFANFDD